MSVTVAETELPRRAMLRSSLAVGTLFAALVGGLLFLPLTVVLGWFGGIAALVVGAAVPFLVRPWMVTARPVRMLRARAAGGRVADVVDSAVIAFGLEAGAVSPVVVDTPVLNCGAFPTRDKAVAVWVTSGLVEALDRSQLEAVLFSQIAVANEPRIQRAAVNEALIRLALIPSFVAVFTAGALFAHPFPVFFAPFLAFGLYWKRESFTFARIKAADAVTANTTMLPEAITSAFELIGERTTEARYAITLSVLVDPFSLVATGAGVVKKVNSATVSTTAGAERALLKSRAGYLRAVLSGESTEIDLDAEIFAESEEFAYDDSSWYPDPYLPDVPQLRRFKDGEWFPEVKPEQGTLNLWKMKPQWTTDPYWYSRGVKRWWDGKRYTGYTHPPVVPPGATPPGSELPPAGPNPAK